MIKSNIFLIYPLLMSSNETDEFQKSEKWSKPNNLSEVIEKQITQIPDRPKEEEDVF